MTREAAKCSDGLVGRGQSTTSPSLVSNTRSKTRRALASPDTPCAPADKQARRLATPPPIRTVCSYRETGECTCGSDYRPRNPTCYTGGRAPANNSISEAFLLQNLGVTESELCWMICLRQSCLFSGLSTPVSTRGSTPVCKRKSRVVKTKKSGPIGCTRWQCRRSSGRTTDQHLSPVQDGL